MRAADGLHASASRPAFKQPARVPRRRRTCPPAARRSASSALPNGAAMYAYNVRWHTTTQHDAAGDPRDRPRRGQAHPRRDGRRRWRAPASRAASTSSRRSCARIRSSSSRTPRRCSPAYRDIAKRVDPELAHLFGTLPRTPYGVRAGARRRRAVADDRLLRARARSRPAGPATCSRTPTSSTRGRSGRWRR